MKKKHLFYYGWVIAGVSFFCLFVSLGIRFSYGLFYVAILNDYGWGRAETAGAFSLAMVIHAGFAVVSGNLIDRFGPRTIFPLGATFLALGLAAASRISAMWHLYLFFGVVMTMGANVLSYATHMAVIPKWFIRKRGLVAGFVLAGIGLGTMVMAPVIRFLIDTVGWRSTFLILSGLVLSVLVPMTALLYRRSPEEVGQFPDGVVPDSRETQNSPLNESVEDLRFSRLSRQWTLRSALCSGAFWWMVLVNFCVGFFLIMLVVHQAAHVVDAGYSLALAAFVVGLVGLLRSAGGVLCGFLSDRVGREIGLTIGSSFIFLGVSFFLLVRDTGSLWILCAFVLLYGLGHGSTGPIIAATMADLFPGNSLGRIMGTFEIGFGIGGALGPYLAGYFYDQRGSYTIPFLLLLVSVSLGVLGIWMAAPRHRQTRSLPKAY
jgi:MFS family permease